MKGRTYTGCAQARRWLVEWADGDLAAARLAWIEEHWRECPSCAHERDRFRALDRRWLSYGETLNPRDSVLAAKQKYGRMWRWNPAAALVAAAVLLTVTAPSRPPQTPRAAAFEDAGFVESPFVPPIAPYERAEVVSVRISVSTLLAAGYRVAADPSSVVEADVLLGEDGQAHAVRLASNEILN